MPEINKTFSALMQDNICSHDINVSQSFLYGSLIITYIFTLFSKILHCLS